jgi:hypothetical protein
MGNDLADLGSGVCASFDCGTNRGDVPFDQK